MSSSPKYSPAQLERQRRERLERKRRQRAAEEARRRREAEARDRKRRLERKRRQIQDRTQHLNTQLSQHQPHLYPDAAQTLHHQLQRHQHALQHADSESTLHQISQHLDQLQQDLQQHLAQKRRDDEDKKRKAELDRQQFALDDLQRQLHQIPDAAKFAPDDRTAVVQTLETVRQAIASGNPATVRQPLQNAESALDRHRQHVARQRAEWQRRQAAAERDLGELHSLIAGLQADPVVMQWQHQAVTQLQAQLQRAEEAVASEQFEQVAPILATCQQQSQTLIDTANAAQLQADQRDYIANSIADSLEALGFNLVYRQAEHPDSPASAVILAAATHSGKGISVSVPVEGEVLYDVEGYNKSTVAAVGGGSAAICDEAEQVIGEMHGLLESEFGVQMGELQWEGKDPNRRIRQADDLPRSEGSRMRGA